MHILDPFGFSLAENEKDGHERKEMRYREDGERMK